MLPFLYPYIAFSMTDEQTRQYRRVLRTYKLQAVENGKIPNASFELDKNAAYVTGLQISGPSKSKINFRGRFGLRIDKEELIETGTPASQFVSTVSVAPNQRFFPLGDVAVTTGIVDIDYTDADNAAAAFSGGYQVDVIFEVLLNKD